MNCCKVGLALASLLIIRLTCSTNCGDIFWFTSLNSSVICQYISTEQNLMSMLIDWGRRHKIRLNIPRSLLKLSIKSGAYSKFGPCRYSINCGNVNSSPPASQPIINEIARENVQQATWSYVCAMEPNITGMQSPYKSASIKSLDLPD